MTRAAASFRSPPIPDPGFGVDRFAHRSQDRKSAHVVVIGTRWPLLHEGARNRRGSRYKQAHGPCGFSITSQNATGFEARVAPSYITVVAPAEKRGPIDECVGGAGGDPGHVGRAPVDVVFAQVEDPTRM